MYVLTVDQRDSRGGDDHVPALLDDLNRRTPSDGLLRGFERTAGDEVQGILTSPDAVLTVVLDLLRREQWNVGLGIGTVQEPLPPSTRAGRGEAFTYARDAVTRAKRGPHHVAVTGADAGQADSVETVLSLVAFVLARRTAGGWEVIDLLTAGHSRGEAAHRLGITESAVAQRLRAGGWTEQQRAERLAVQLLAEEESS